MLRRPSILPVLSQALIAVALSGVFAVAPGCKSPATVVECSGGTWDDDGDPTTACIPWSACEAGTRVATAGTPTQDRTCTTCETGSFTDYANRSACEPWTDCVAGQFVVTEGSSSNDRFCAPCADGLTTTEPNASECTPLDGCAAGSAGEDCAPCAVGTYCPGGDVASVACSGTTWDHDADPATACEPWTDCIPGEAVEADGSATTDRSCTACEDGAFSVATNASTCATWAVCAPGSYVTSSPTASSDRTCSACPSGTFTDAENLDLCDPWTDCVPGEYVETAGSSSSDRFCVTCTGGLTTFGPNESVCYDPSGCAAGTSGDDCTPCAVGTYCAGGDAEAITCDAGTWDHDANPATVCAAWTDCVPGQFVEQEGDAVTDRSCTTCAGDAFSEATNASMCTTWSICGPGTYEDGAGTQTTDRSCSACATGSFTAADNLDTCSAWSDCVPGEYVETAGTPSSDRVCTECTGGLTTLGPNETECYEPTGCDPGTAGTDCTPCAVGTYCAGGGADEVPCDDGTWDHDADPSTACEPWTICLAGQFIDADGDATNDRSCLDCDGGSYSDSDDALACAPWSTCVPGTYEEAPGTDTSDRACASCQDGYTDIDNATSCTPWTTCPDGELAEGTPTSDAVCFEPVACATLLDENSCRSSLVGCAWDGAACNDQTCDELVDAAACDRLPGCEFDEAGSGLCEVDATPPNSCDDILDPARCDASGLGCAWDGAACNDSGEPVDCEVGDFGDWSTCSLPCDGGEQIRTRVVLQQPSNGGAACPELEESIACNTGVPCVCSELVDEPQCLLVDTCLWDVFRCVDANPPDSCDLITDQQECETSALGCVWLDALASCFTP